ncbi:cyclase-associated protein 1-like, partial [Trifolium medium]|nr:cyclase-associated protein 1-like [Trifolium medium]
KPDPAGLSEFLKPLNEVITKAAALTEGRRSDFFNHLKAAVDSMSMPVAHVEESWQMAEFYSNKVLLMDATFLFICLG